MPTRTLSGSGPGPISGSNSVFIPRYTASEPALATPTPPAAQKHGYSDPSRSCDESNAVGQRVWPTKYGFLRLPDGGYGQDMQGKWWVRPPGRNTTLLTGCSKVVEHLDETLSTVLSGYWRLEKGVWLTW